ncbi:MAG: hypothetical protein KAS32_14270 [Candidatus Peribacteraceae bacterium]|nr:hypothetical protein [Candidatus Peribacteraceae bacterium]
MKCPKCKTEIEYLHNFETGYQRWNFTPNTEELNQYTDPTFTSDGDITEYECPACGETLATSEMDAMELFKKKKVKG